MTIKGVDLLPTEKRKIGFDPMFIVMLVLIGVAVLICMNIGKSYQKKITEVETQIAEVEKKIKDTENQMPIVDQLQNDITRFQAQIQTIKTLHRDPIKYSNILIEFASLMPSNVWIDNLSIEPGSNLIRFGGTAAQAGNAPPLWTIAYFMKTINNSRYFSGANISGVSQSKTETMVGYTFQMQVNYDPQVASEEIESSQQNLVPPANQNLTPPAQPVNVAPEQKSNVVAPEKATPPVNTLEPQKTTPETSTTPSTTTTTQTEKKEGVTK